MSEQLKEAISNYDAKEDNTDLKEALRGEIRKTVQEVVNETSENEEDSETVSE